MMNTGDGWMCLCKVIHHPDSAKCVSCNMRRDRLFEHKILVVHPEEFESGHVAARLDALSAERWELVGAQYVTALQWAREGWYYTLKREVLR